MAWVKIELEYTCPICGGIQIINQSAYIRYMGKKASLRSGYQHCADCESLYGIIKELDVSRMSITVKDNFEISIF